MLQGLTEKIGRYLSNSLTYNILTDKLAYYKVMTTVNWNTPTWANLNILNRVTTSVSGDTVYPFYAGDSNNLLVYFVRNMFNAHGHDTSADFTTSTSSYYSSNSVTNMSVTFTGFPNNTLIRLRWYNPRTGDEIPNTTSTFSNTSTTVTAPEFNRDLVAVLKPE